MMTQQLGFSILSAPLAAIDRRALSQAWYSALHLARDSSPLPAPKGASAAPQPQSTAPLVRRDTTPAAQPKAGARDLRVPAGPSRLRAEALDERRASRSPLARKIERAFRQPVPRASGITLGVEGSRGRVHIALQVRGNRVRLVALCGSNVRHAVAHALSQARYTLAGRGIELDASVAEASQCS